MKLFSRKPKKPNTDHKGDMKAPVKDTLEQPPIDQAKVNPNLKDKNSHKSKKAKSDQILPTETLQDRIKTLRTLCDVSRPKLAAKYNISFSTLRSWENVNCQLSHKSLHRLMTLFRHEGLLIDEAWLLTGKGVAPVVAADKINIAPLTTSSGQQPLLNQNPLNPIQSEVDAFLHNNRDAQVMSVDQDYPLYHLHQGDLIGGSQVNLQDLTIGPVCLALITLHHQHRLDQTNPLQPKLKRHQDAKSVASSAVAAPDQLLQLCQVQRLDNDHVIAAPLNSSPTQWHQFIYRTSDITILYRVCWIRHQSSVK